MLNRHLSEEEIQQYTLDESHAGPGIGEHVRLCEACKTKVETYRLLFTGINQQPEPRFDFDLSELVLAQLPSPAKKSAADRTIIYLLSAIIIALTGILLYFFNDYLFILFSGFAPLLSYLIIPSLIIIMILLGIDMYKNYQKKMNALLQH